MKLKILFLITRLDNKGPINQLYSLVKGLRERNDIEISILTMYDEIQDTRMSDFRQLGVHIFSLHIKKKYNLIGAKNIIENIICDIKPDIIHSATLPADILAGIANKGDTKWCTTLHCNMYMDYISLFGNFKAHFYILVHRLTLQKADRIICCSKTNGEIYANKKWKNITVIQNGIDVSEISEIMGYEVNELREKLGIATNRKILVVVGSIDERKNSKFIIETFLKIKSDIDLIFLGEGPQKEECILMNVDRVFFKGKVNNVPLYLRCADIYISASKSEGLPLSVIEAGCYGKSMVLSNIGPHKEIVESVGLSEDLIVLADINETDAFAKAIDEIIGKKRNDEGISKAFIDKFNNDLMVEKYVHGYNGLMRGLE